MCWFCADRWVPPASWADHVTSPGPRRLLHRQKCSEAQEGLACGRVGAVGHGLRPAPDTLLCWPSLLWTRCSQNLSSCAP